MNLSTLQRRAWEIAEAQGHHDALRHPEPDARLAALAGLAEVYTRLNDITQVVKRDGITDASLHAIEVLMGQFREAFMQWFLHTLDHSTTALPHYATLVRLVLLHTEVSEAIDVAHDEPRLARELADVLIRVGDLAEERGLQLGKAVVEVMERNLQRPYKYGTPEEGETP